METFQFVGTELVVPARSKLGRHVHVRSLTRTHQRPEVVFLFRLNLRKRVWRKRRGF